MPIIAPKLNVMHNWLMRTTVNLDEDVHDIVSNYARAKGLSLSAAINEITRKAQNTPEPEPVIRRGPNGLPLLPRSGRVITCEMVKELSEDELG
jgi:hypothetical protein